MIQKVQFAGIFHKYVVTRAGIRIKKWRWSSNAPNWTFNGQKQPQWDKISKIYFEKCNLLRILSDICVTAKKLRRRFNHKNERFLHRKRYLSNEFWSNPLTLFTPFNLRIILQFALKYDDFNTKEYIQRF